MRGLAIEISGLRSWHSATIELTGRDLLFVLGVTGSCKSWILVAIAFSLFARTPVESRSGRLLRSGAEQDLARRVRDLVPDAIRVEPAVSAQVAAEAADETTTDSDLAELYAEWYAREGRPLSDAQQDAFALAREAAS